jgi:hypothetical protein
MLASSAARLPEGEQWSYEVKWDGYTGSAMPFASGTTA